MSKVQTNQMILILSTITTLLLGLWMVILVIGICLFIMSLAGDTSLVTNFEWPIIFSDQLLQNHYSEIAETLFQFDKSEFGSMTQLTTTLNPFSEHWPYFEIYNKGMMLLKLSLYMGIVFFLDRILDGIKKQIPFNQVNIRRLKFMALLILAMVPLAILENWLGHWYIMQYVDANHMQFVSRLSTSDINAMSFLQPNEILLSNQIQLKPIAFAAFVYVLALVFQEGLQLKRDNESIV